ALATQPLKAAKTRLETGQRPETGRKGRARWNRVTEAAPERDTLCPWSSRRRKRNASAPRRASTRPSWPNSSPRANPSPALAAPPTPTPPPAPAPSAASPPATAAPSTPDGPLVVPASRPVAPLRHHQGWQPAAQHNP